MITMMTDGQSSKPRDRVRVTLPSRREAVAEAIAHVMQEVETAGFDESSIFAIRLAIEEATSNAIRHGNAGDPDKQIVIEYHVNEESFEIAIEDEGTGFDPDAVPDPTLDENIERPSGRGIMLMRAYMTSVEYNDRGNRVSLRFRLPA